MIFKAYAKINIGLRVLNKRRDGYHNIETFFQQIDLYDKLDIIPTDDGQIELTCSDPACPTDESNLVIKAAQLLQSRRKLGNLGCKIGLEKSIPMGGGLGGGSSDAAATLLALNKLWDVNFNTEKLSEIALAIGSDVPFFLKGGFALGSGRGELLTPINLKMPFYGLLHCPGISISTPWAYKNLNLDLTKSDKIAKFIDFVPELHSRNLWAKNLPNDLETVVFAAHKNFAETIEQFYDAGAFYARMSGSGSTLYGLFDTLKAAKNAQQHLASRFDTTLFAPV